MTETKPKTATADPLETDNFIETYQIIAEWIRFADAKAAVVLTAIGALATVLIPTFKPFLEQDAALHPFKWWAYPVAGLFGLWLVATGLSSIWAFSCINPIKRRGHHPSLDHCDHFHPAAISAKYSIDETKKFLDDCADLGMSGFKREVIAGMLVDAHISSIKYKRVTTSIRLLGVSAVLGVLYALAIQF